MRCCISVPQGEAEGNFLSGKPYAWDQHVCTCFAWKIHHYSFSRMFLPSASTVHDVLFAQFLTWVLDIIFCFPYEYWTAHMYVFLMQNHLARLATWLGSDPLWLVRLYGLWQCFCAHWAYTLIACNKSKHNNWVGNNLIIHHCISTKTKPQYCECISIFKMLCFLIFMSFKI